MSFFVAGGTVPPGLPSYVERAADRELFEALLASEFCYVLNSRQMGKSSLAVRTIARLQEAGVRTAFVDLTRIGSANLSAEQWYAGLLAEVGRALGLRSEAVRAWRESPEMSYAQRLFGFLQERAADRPTVVMIDEIDATRSLGFSTDEFFAGIRQCWNARATDPTQANLTLCLLGAALPSDLIRDPRVTPFNVGRRVELRDFSANGKWMVYESGAGNLLMRNLLTGATKNLGAPLGDYEGTTISADGSRLVSVFGLAEPASAPKGFLIRDGRDGRVVIRRKLPSPLGSVRAIAPEGRTVLVSYRNAESDMVGVAEYDYARDRIETVYALQAESGTLSKTGEPIAVGASFGPEASSVVLSIPGRIAVFQRHATTPKKIVTSDSDGNPIYLSNDGRWALTQSEYNGSTVIDLVDGRKAFHVLGDRCGLSPDGLRLYTWTTAVTALDWRQSRPHVVLPDAKGVHSAESFTNGRKGCRTCLVAEADGTSAGRLVSYTQDGRLVGRFPRRSGETLGKNWGIERGFLYTSPHDDTIEVRDTMTFDLVARILGARLNQGAAMATDERRFLGVDRRGALRVWEPGPDGWVARARPLASRVARFSLSPNGRLVELQPDFGGRVQLLDVVKAEEISSFTVPSTGMVAWSPRSDALVYVGAGVERFDALTRRSRSLVPADGQPVRALAFSPDARRLAVWRRRGDVIEIRETSEGRLVTRLDLPSSGRTRTFLADMTFSPDGKNLLASMSDGRMLVYQGGSPR